jgi:AmpD protein
MQSTLSGMIKKGLLQAVPFHPSPNCDDRPDPNDINLLVIHGISLPPGEFGGNAVDDLFMNNLDYTQHPFYQSLLNLQVSIHLFIRRSGEIIQYVPFNLRAWHAGKSSFEGREHCNDFSIGIELEGCDNVPYTELQYQQLAAVTRLLMQYYPLITPARIVGHSDIAPGRKTDPGEAFDWDNYRQLLQN